MISGYVRIAADLTMANDEVRCAIDRNHVYCAGLEAESEEGSEGRHDHQELINIYALYVSNMPLISLRSRIPV